MLSHKAVLMTLPSVVLGRVYYPHLSRELSPSMPFQVLAPITAKVQTGLRCRAPMQGNVG